ncbi:hypothetical protein [Streptomyces rubrogriseus]|uniref:Uncharacterized protein n=1 Tax=Streptomyces rubrogriseus TaxID=194673 RepID=A0ABT4P057_9ACTN|nr:hypothetical protein [Streptomyces rubrogriseus]MCZ4634774.1 hypothetical protein [Streptomyces rubrogriseus]
MPPRGLQPTPTTAGVEPGRRRPSLGEDAAHLTRGGVLGTVVGVQRE